MSAEAYKVLSDTLYRILLPLARLMLRNGVTHQAFTELSKLAFVEIAAAEFRIPGRKQSDSRISVITGLTRKEVKRITNANLPRDPDTFVRYNRAARVISGWVQDADFCDSHGNPLDLPVDGENPSFSDLVRRYSGDAPARAVRDELERVGAVEVDPQGKVVLKTRAYIPETDDIERIAVIGSSVGALLETVEHNCWHPDDERRFQRQVANRRVTESDAKEFELVASRKAQQLLETLDQWLAEREVTDGSREALVHDTKRVGLGLYCFEEDNHHNS